MMACSFARNDRATCYIAVKFTFFLPLSFCIRIFVVLICIDIMYSYHIFVSHVHMLGVLFFIRIF